jgi:hypothetical protein
MKNLILIAIVLITMHSYGQDDKIVSLVVSGQGKTQEEARQSALRSAIEQAFGAFISSKTEILDDKIIKDEITSVSNGNIKHFEIITEVKLPEGDYASTLKATVSVSKLSTFCEAKGVATNFNGNLFAFNINQMELNEKNEVKAISNLVDILNKLCSKSFDYSIAAKDPILIDNSSQLKDKSVVGKWKVPLIIDVTVNKNFEIVPTLIYKTLNELSLNQDGVASYLKLNKPVYYVTYAANEKLYNHFCLRNKESLNILGRFILSLKDDILNFTINNGLNKLKLKDISYNSYVRELPAPVEDNFDIILRKYQNNAYNSTPITTSLFKTIYGGGVEWKVFFEPLDFQLNDFYLVGGLYTKLLYVTYYPNKEEFKIFDANWGFIADYIQEEGKGWCRNSNLGLVISFINVIPGKKVATYNFHDVRTLEELKKISQYKIDAF